MIWVQRETERERERERERARVRVSSLSLFDARDREGRIQNGVPFFFYARASVCDVRLVKMRTRELR
jgi:hypothetical protein